MAKHSDQDGSSAGVDAGAMAESIYQDLIHCEACENLFGSADEGIAAIARPDSFSSADQEEKDVALVARAQPATSADHQPASTVDSDPVLADALSRITNDSRYELICLVGGAVVRGRVVDANLWAERVEAVAGFRPLAGDSEADVGYFHPVSRPREVYLRERLRWGFGVSDEQLEELRGRPAPSGRYFHLLDVSISTSAGAMNLRSWRGHLASVDGFSIVQEGVDQADA